MKIIMLIIIMENENISLIFEIDQYLDEVENEQNRRASFQIDAHGCFNHRPGKDYTGPLPKSVDVKYNDLTYPTDNHGCFNHASVQEYTGPIPNNEINPQSNYPTYETDQLGNMIDSNNLYSGPRPNQSEEAQNILKVAAAHKIVIEKSLEKYFKRKNKRFMKGWYTTTIKKPLN